MNKKRIICSLFLMMFCFVQTGCMVTRSAVVIRTPLNESHVNADAFMRGLYNDLKLRYECYEEKNPQTDALILLKNIEDGAFVLGIGLEIKSGDLEIWISGPPGSETNQTFVLIQKYILFRLKEKGFKNISIKTRGTPFA